MYGGFRYFSASATNVLIPFLANDFENYESDGWIAKDDGDGSCDEEVEYCHAIITPIRLFLVS